MKAYTKDNIRNIVIAGHGGRGKTTLAEAMLYIAGETDRLGGRRQLQGRQDYGQRHFCILVQCKGG